MERNKLREYDNSADTSEGDAVIAARKHREHALGHGSCASEHVSTCRPDTTTQYIKISFLTHSKYYSMMEKSLNMTHESTQRTPRRQLVDELHKLLLANHAASLDRPGPEGSLHVTPTYPCLSVVYG